MSKVYVVLNSEFDGVWYHTSVYGVYADEKDAQNAVDNASPRDDLDYDAYDLL